MTASTRTHYARITILYGVVLVSMSYELFFSHYNHPTLFSPSRNSSSATRIRIVENFHLILIILYNIPSVCDKTTLQRQSSSTLDASAGNLTRQIIFSAVSPTHPPPLLLLRLLILHPMPTTRSSAIALSYRSEPFLASFPGCGQYILKISR